MHSNLFPLSAVLGSVLVMVLASCSTNDAATPSSTNVDAGSSSGETLVDAAGAQPDAAGDASDGAPAKTCSAPTPDLCGSGSAAACVDLTSDPKNCGACGARCSVGGYAGMGTAQQCLAGFCGCAPATPKMCGTGSTATCVAVDVDCPITVDPKTYAFPTAFSTELPTSKVFTFKNLGTTPSGALSVSFATASESNAYFNTTLVDGCSGKTLALNETCTVTVTNRTNSGLTGSDSATLTVTPAGGAPVVATMFASIRGI
jgi:hypothetical protein